jgi:hypothetical protein
MGPLPIFEIGGIEMRKTFAVLAVLVMVAALFAMPGLAAARGGNGGGNGGGTHKGGNGGTWFNLYGTITSLGLSDKTIVVDVKSPLNLLKYNPLTVKTTVDTRFRDCEQDIRIDFNDLEEAATVRIKGVVKDGVFVATLVILNPEYVPTSLQ